jgi:catechol 2,3-dioxygenase-like lactoylglutathione lyase family enzyme
MLTGIDHIVIVVAELEGAIQHYTAAGFTVVRGGRHNTGTHNALVGFADGAYLELIAFLDPNADHPWHEALARGGGIVDFCVRTDDLAADLAALSRVGARFADPVPMTRERPDGYRLSWALALPEPSLSGALPLLIKDETPRGERVPTQRIHRNGITGLHSLTVAVEDPDHISVYYAAVLGTQGVPVVREDLDAAGIAFTIGPHRVQLIAPKPDAGVFADFIAVRGRSPYEAMLTSTAPSARLEPSLLESARLRIVSA